MRNYCDICGTEFEHDSFRWIDDKDIGHLVCSECHWELLKMFGAIGTPESYIFKQ